MKWTHPICVLAACVILGCESHTQKELLYEGDSGLWCVDSVSGSTLNEFRLFHRDGTLEEYQLAPDDSLYAIDYGDVVPCLTWKLGNDVISFDCQYYHVDQLDSGKMTLTLIRDSSVRYYYSKSKKHPIARVSFDFDAYRRGDYMKTPR